ncbi:hypothetical protein K501DRAFT_338972 [Backusella circina FSU 941]|nr:hypothetical protein K501DRAFT_338972 [Backusella circina FSU 941]
MAKLYLTAGSSEKDTDSLEHIRDGYAPLHAIGNDVVRLTGNKKKRSLSSILDNLHRPYLDFKVVTDSPIQPQNIPFCTKLDFLVKLLTMIKLRKVNLDVAIICSSNDLENLLVDTLRLKEMEYMPLSEFPDSQNTGVYGVLVRFRRAESTRQKFRMRVDHIIVYDSALVTDRVKIGQPFHGVYHDKPQIISLVCLQTPDVRLCHYRDDHPEIIIDAKQPLDQLPKNVTTLLKNPMYKRVKMSQRARHNNYILEIVSNWMLLKDGTVFSLEGLKKKSRHQMKTEWTQDGVNDVASSSSSSSSKGFVVVHPVLKMDQGAKGVKRAPVTDDTNTKEKKTKIIGSDKSEQEESIDTTTVKLKSTPEEALCSSLYEFESALDQAYKDLERSIYG